MRDMVRRGRHVYARFKLTIKQVKEIRADTDSSLRVLAAKYNVSPDAIRKIRLGITYKYVTV